MSSYKHVQNRLHKLKVEIMAIEKSIEKAELENKPHFALRLRMMIQKKIEKINSLSKDA